MGNCFTVQTNNNENKEIKNIEIKETKVNIINLKDINEKDVEYFTFKGKRLRGKYCNVYDGDTFSLIFEYRGEVMKYKCRCLGYDTPEMKPPLNSPNREKEIEMAKKAKQRFIDLMNKSSDGLIEVDCFEFDKYGRILVNVFNGVDTKSLNDIMVEEGHGLRYDGGTKTKFNFDD